MLVRRVNTGNAFSRGIAGCAACKAFIHVRSGMEGVGSSHLPNDLGGCSLSCSEAVNDGDPEFCSTGKVLSHEPLHALPLSGRRRRR